MRSDAQQLILKAAIDQPLFGYNPRKCIFKMMGQLMGSNKKRPEGRINIRYMAEAVRFELTDPFESPVFKTGAIDHSATLPAGEIVTLF